MLAVVFPGIEPWRPLLELAAAGRDRRARAARDAAGAPLLARLGGDAARLILVVSAPSSSITSARRRHSFTQSPAHGLLPGAANIALLFLCGSLPLFLGAEVVGGAARSAARSPIAGIVAAAYLLFAVFAFAAVDPALPHADLPGYAIACAYSGRTFAIVVGLGAAASVAGLIVAEYLALSRLLFAVHRGPGPQARQPGSPCRSSRSTR